MVKRKNKLETKSTRLLEEGLSAPNKFKSFDIEVIGGTFHITISAKN